MRKLVCVVLFSALAAACGGMNEADPTAADETLESGAAHALPWSLTPESEASARGARLRYYGGPVLESARVVAVLWGKNVDPAVASRIGDFYKDLVSSSYFDWLGEYDTTVPAVDGKPGTGQRIQRGKLAGVFTIAPHAKGAALSDAQVEKELAAQIRAGKLPKPDASTVYQLHFPPGVRISMGGSRSCESGGFCGYHSAFRQGRARVAYAVLPDMSAGSGCDVGCGKSKTALDLVTAVASHELVEATTDPEVGLARGLSAPLAWYDAQRGEIGDICNGSTGKLRAGGASWTVQKEWSNKAGACVLGRGRGAESEPEGDGG